MKKLGLILLVGGAGLTVLFIVLWILGFFIASAAVGSLIHLLIVAAFFTGIVALVGLVVFLIGLSTRKDS
jgi:hypothetical protein